MHTKTLALVLAAALLAGSAHTVFAGENAPPPPPGPDRAMGRQHPGFDRDGRRGGPDRDWRGGPGHRWFDGPGMGRGMGPGGCKGPGCGGPGMGMGMGMRHGFGPRMMEILDLNEAQKSAVVDLLTENFRAGLKLRMETMDARKKLREVGKDDKAAAEDIIAAHTALGALEGRREALVKKAREDFRNVLTPEQLKKLDDLRDRRFGFRDRDDDGRREHRFGPRDRDDDGRPDRDRRDWRGPRHGDRDGDGDRDGRRHGPGPR